MFKDQNFQNDMMKLIDQMYQGFLISDLDGRIIYANHAVEKISGFSLDKIIGKTPEEMQQDGIISEQTVRVRSQEPITMVHKLSNGKEIFITSKPIYDDDGKIICFVVNYMDLTTLNNLKASHIDRKESSESRKNSLPEMKSWIGESFHTHQLKERIAKIAKTEAIVLITGESGVGKEVVANHIHKLSHRKDQPYIQINCGAIPKDLIEAELFGYEQGAFTGATNSKAGLFEIANGGTVLLDEIGEMPLDLQVKLLRVIQTNKITRVGGTKEIKLNIRFIAATNKNLLESVKQGKFREDLFYRLNVIPLEVLPLRKRREDILPLCNYFLEYYNKKYAKNKAFTPEIMQLFQDYNWPGNVRQLKNIVERLVIISEENNISPKYLPNEFKAKEVIDLEIKPLKEVREEAEKYMIELAMRKYGSTRKAAKHLQVSHSTIVRKMNQLGL